MDPADPHDLRIAAEEPILDTKQIAISGQHDPGDARLVEETLLKVNGVKGVTVSAAEGVAEVILHAQNRCARLAGCPPARRPSSRPAARPGVLSGRWEGFGSSYKKG